MGARTSIALLAVALAATGAAASCGAEPPRRAAPPRPAAPAWADILDGTPDLYAVFRPRAIKRDGVYGTFFKALVRAAQARGIARGDTMVQAAEGADEIIVAIEGGGDAALVIRGVPANLDPQTITDAEGRALFRPTSDDARAIEYELIDRTEAGALFVLPDRTWVGALGDLRGRARQAFASPMNRPAPDVEPDALAAVRVSGPLVHALDRHPALGLLANKLTSATFALQPGAGGVVARLSYADGAAAARAEMYAKRLVAELAADADAGAGDAGAADAGAEGARWAWLASATVAYQGTTLVVRVAVPPRLLEELPRVSGADLGL